MSMLDLFAIAAPALPLLLGCVVPIASGASPERAARLAWYGAAAALASVAIAGLGRVLSSWPVPSLAESLAMQDASSWGLLQLDALGSLMLATIALIGAVVARFALRYLHRDPAQRSFSIWLSYTLAAISMLPLASNLVVLFLAWVMSSHGLHRLLTLYTERPAAIWAARRKFVISRLGDLFLAVAFVWMYSEWGSLEFATIFERAASDSLAGRGAPLFWISSLIILGAITKSAQFPFHTWLPDTMESPTPVSALMHAGIINAGGFLLVRMSPLLALAPNALTWLAFVGAFSAMTTSLIMLTQNDVKRKLAYSTTSQMGFMMLQVGLGAFGAAMLHIVGHSFYKAHAFLSAGSWVDPKGVSGTHAHLAPPASFARIAGATAIGFALAIGAVLVMGVDPSQKPGGWVLVCVLAIALSQGVVIWTLLSTSSPWHPRNLAIVGLAGGVFPLVYLGLVGFVDALLAGSISRPVLAVADPASLPGAALVLMFVAAMVLQMLRPTAAPGRAWTRLYILLRNGFHLGEIQDRWVRQLWRRLPTEGRTAP